MQRSVKQLPGSFQERRRAQALEQQKNARRQATDRARKLALGADDAEDASQEPQQVRGGRDALPWGTGGIAACRRLLPPPLHLGSHNRTEKALLCPHALATGCRHRAVRCHCLSRGADGRRRQWAAQQRRARAAGEQRGQRPAAVLRRAADAARVAGGCAARPGD